MALGKLSLGFAMHECSFLLPLSNLQSALEGMDSPMAAVDPVMAQHKSDKKTQHRPLTLSGLFL
jgi:hypothetical protein